MSHDPSLRVLTYRFVNLIKESPDQTIDQNDVATHLSVQKRRIYDITNVLEGIGYVEKILKNTIRWKGQTSIDEEKYKEEISELNQKMTELDLSEKTIDESILKIQNMINDLMTEPESNNQAFYMF